ncbi:hypothetical protein ACIQOW_13665 [Kitasatospora sp. NPDC091335]
MTGLFQSPILAPPPGENSSFLARKVIGASAVPDRVKVRFSA